MKGNIRFTEQRDFLSWLIRSGEAGFSLCEERFIMKSEWREMRHLVISVLFLALLVAGSASAQSEPSSGAAKPSDAPVDPQKAEIIRQIISATRANDLVKQMIDSTMPQVMSNLRQNPLLPPAFIDEAQIKLSERFKTLDLTQFAVPVYSKNFTTEELRQILAFDQSPLGQKVARLQPAIYSEVAAGAKAKGQQIGMDVAREILAEHPEYVRQIQENQRKMQAQTGSAATPPEEPVHKIGDGVTAPVLIKKQEPQYTKEALDAKLNGSVLLSIVVDSTGTPRNIQVVRSLGMGLDEKAIEAVQQWRFQPGTKDGKAVATAARVEVNFRTLQNPPQEQ